MMPLKSTKIYLASWGLLLLWATTASAQHQYAPAPASMDLVSELPYMSGPAPGIEDLQLFDKAPTTTLDGRPYAKEGIYFTYDYFRMSMSNPDRATIGNDAVTPRLVFEGNGDILPRLEANTLDTAIWKAKFRSGHIFEIGYVIDNQGWNARTYDFGGRTNSLYGSDVGVIFRDPQGLLNGFVDTNLDGFDDDINVNGTYGRDGFDSNFDGFPDTFGLVGVDLGDAVPLAVIFDEVTAKLETDLWGIELNRMWRLNHLCYGGYMEIMAGARFMKFRDNYIVRGYGGILDDSSWSTQSENMILGPQIGSRWFRLHGKHMLSADIRFTAAVNAQSIRQRSLMGGRLDQTLTPLVSFAGATYNHTDHTVTFTPIVEVGLEYSYQVTRYFTLSAGWRGIYLDGIARASSMVDYTFPQMGIREDQNMEDVFINGFTVGVELNR